jgi:AraC-like DNA-binding protein
MLMSISLYPHNEVNLASLPDARISASVMNPTGGGARSPSRLLNESALHLDGKPLSDYEQSQTYDTFHGRHEHNELDWYAISWPQAHSLNCIEMTMGYPYRDGGWWTSLGVEVQRALEETWQPVHGLEILPAYDFSDSRAARRPFETHQLFFDDTHACAVRLIGRPGGLAQFTSLARLAVHHRDRSRWDEHSFIHRPMPEIFRLIAPARIWDISDGLMKATGLHAAFPLVDYYLDAERLERSWQREVAGYTGNPHLSLVIGDALGWENWFAQPSETQRFKTSIQPEPYLQLVCDGQLARAVAPVSVEQRVLANMSSSEALLRDRFDLDWHRDFASRHQIAWDVYQRAMTQTPQMTQEQMEGIAEILGVIANAIADLAHRNQLLEGQLLTAQPGSSHTLMRQAVRVMQERLEDDLSVADVAAAIGLNASYFSTVFKRQMGCLPVEMLARLRIERAKEYLRHTDMTVMDVCVALNYTPSYFQRLFKRLVGLTPGEYARQARNVA